MNSEIANGREVWKLYFRCHSVGAAVSVTIVDCCVMHSSPLQKPDDAVICDVRTITLSVVCNGDVLSL
jgi:hypothetical protein